MSSPQGTLGIAIAIVIGVILVPYILIWPAWLSILVVILSSLLILIVLYYLLDHRIYKVEGNNPKTAQLLVKEGLLGKWTDLERHLKEDHEQTR